MKLYLDCNFDNKAIVDYIKKAILDIKYDINIKYLNEKKLETHIDIPAHAIRKLNEFDEFKFFIPFLEDGGVKNINFKDEVINNNYIEKYEYGLLIRKNIEAKSKQVILNAGIAVEQATLDFLFGRNFNKNYKTNWVKKEDFYNDVIINFPANWLQLDVSRQYITGLTEVVNGANSKKKNLQLRN